VTRDVTLEAPAPPQTVRGRWNVRRELNGKSIKRRAESSLLAFVVSACAASPAAAQLPFTPGEGDRELVDRVVAVVGDSAIVMSQVTERLLTLGPETLPTDSVALAELQREVLDALVSEQLLLQGALQDTLITVDEGRMDDIVDQEMESRTQSMGGQAGLQRALVQEGFTLASYREYLGAEARKQHRQQQYLARQAAVRRPVIIEESEMREFFEAQRESLPERPASITFANVVLGVQASDSAMQGAKAEAERILALVMQGEDFSELAERNSDDPGSRETGGDLGWFRRGSGFVKEFEDAAFELRPGQVSVPIETQFGYHLIMVERVRGPERTARHILIRPEITPADLERARDRADELRSRLDAGEAFEVLQAEIGDGPIPDTATVAANQLSQLPPGYGAALQAAQADDIVGPIEFAQADQASFGLVKVVEVREAGIATFEDVEGEIQQVLSQQKMQELIIDELRAATYVDIRM